MILDASGARALIECKGADDGSTAPTRRLGSLDCDRRVSGSVVFPSLPSSGVGWRRVDHTLGPVVRDTDGRVLTPSNLPELMTVHPFPQIVASLPTFGTP